MFDQMDHQIDAVTISTPDHMHAIIASAAMKRNKAVFCQKPLTQTIYEARYLRKMAKKKKLVTQMGNQGSAADGLRRAVETIQDGLIGQVHEVAVISNAGKIFALRDFFGVLLLFDFVPGDADAVVVLKRKLHRLLQGNAASGSSIGWLSSKAECPREQQRLDRFSSSARLAREILLH